MVLTLIIMLSSCSSKEEDVILDTFSERWDSLELKTDFVDEIAILRIVEVVETDYYEGDADNFDTSPITKYDDRHIIGGLYNHAIPQQIQFLDNYDSSLDFYSQNKDIQSMVAEITTILENLENKEE